MKVRNVINTDEGAVEATPIILNNNELTRSPLMSTNTYTPSDSFDIQASLREWFKNMSWKEYHALTADNDPQCTPVKSGWEGFSGSVAGPNHPSRLWHQNRPAEWVENCREGTLKEWQGERGETRRKTHSDKLKETWKNNREHMVSHCRKVATKGGIASREKNGTRIEYYGKTYIGWKTFMKETGVSKHLYKRYYLNGVNPEYRIGMNGPEAA